MSTPEGPRPGILNRSRLSSLLGENARVALINAPTRLESKGGFPPLLVDARENHFFSVPGRDIITYVKPVAGPYTGVPGNHFLLVPDTRGVGDLPSIQALSPQNLGTVMRTAESLARHTLAQQGISEVDFGINRAFTAGQGNLKQRAVTFPDNLHVHVTGYAKENLSNQQGEVVKTPDLLAK